MAKRSTASTPDADLATDLPSAERAAAIGASRRERLRYGDLVDVAMLNPETGLHCFPLRVSRCPYFGGGVPHHFLVSSTQAFRES